MSEIDPLQPINYDTLQSPTRMDPEPKSDFLKSMYEFGSKVAEGALAVTIDPEYAALLQKQLEVQQQLQMVSMESNLLRSRHETDMAPIRNIRVG